jgi:hypothetical protein
MTVTFPSLSTGPKLSNVEKGVHILRLSITGGESGAASPDSAVEDVARKIGPPKPTDIIVFDRQPLHFAGGALHAHPQVHVDHPETILELSISRRERAVWWSELNFTITDIDYSHHAARVTGAPKDPFSAPLQTRQEDDGAGKIIYVVRSTVPVVASQGQTYKIKFTIGGDDIDPDMSCNP